MKKTFLKSLALTAVGSFCLAGTALATQMTGGIGMTGAVSPIDSLGIYTTIPLSTGLDFLGIYVGGIDNTFLVTSGSGDFTGLSGQTGQITDFQFDPAAPVLALWSVGGFSFDLLTYTAHKESSGNNSYSLDISGTGTLTGNGFEPTSGFWNFTGQGANFANFSWSASTNANPVPEPATMLLFGTGLIGLGGISARRNKTKSNQNDICSGC